MVYCFSYNLKEVFPCLALKKNKSISIKKYKKKRELNLGIFLFAIVFLYLVIMIFCILQTTKFLPTRCGREALSEIIPTRAWS